MPIQANGGWECKICHTIYDRDILALSCEQGHDIIYIPVHREDLFKLIQFMYTKDESLLSKTLVETLQKYTRGNYV